MASSKRPNPVESDPQQPSTGGKLPPGAELYPPHTIARGESWARGGMALQGMHERSKAGLWRYKKRTLKRAESECARLKRLAELLKNSPNADELWNAIEAEGLRELAEDLLR